MASGFFALLDDIAVLARATAASMDDIALGAAKASAKSAGIIVDDAAVTPQYVAGISPKRELAVIGRIALGSIINKLVFIIPAALILTWLAPWMLPYLLILGGAYLVFEGAEKVLVWLGVVKHHEHTQAVGGSASSEKKIVNSAVRTDLVLSTEIMLISLSALEIGDNWISKAVALIFIALLMTVLVYGTVALLIRMDDLGYHLAGKEHRRATRLFGLGLVKSMPKVFKVLSVVGTVAMLWVGGHLLWKSLGDVGVGFAYDSLHGLEEWLHRYGDFLAWCGDTLASAVFGLLAGLVLAGIAIVIQKVLPKGKRHHEAEAAEAAH